MGRPVYAQELHDPDFAWLISSYKSTHPNALTVESSVLPVVLLEGAAPHPLVETGTPAHAPFSPLEEQD